MLRKLLMPLRPAGRWSSAHTPGRRQQVSAGARASPCWIDGRRRPTRDNCEPPGPNCKTDDVRPVTKGTEIFDATDKKLRLAPQLRPVCPFRANNGSFRVLSVSGADITLLAKMTQLIH